MSKDNGGPASDRELLEMAAKAAGHQISQVSDEIWSDDHAGYVQWTPLTDDGDALRLAVNLGIDLAFYLDSGAVEARTFGQIDDAIEAVSVGVDIHAATRLAIVRAAAAIGSAM